MRVAIVIRTIITTGSHCGKNDLSINGMSEFLDVRPGRTLGESNAGG